MEELIRVFRLKGKFSFKPAYPLSGQALVEVTAWTAFGPQEIGRAVWEIRHNGTPSYLYLSLQASQAPRVCVPLNWPQLKDSELEWGPGNQTRHSGVLEFTDHPPSRRPDLEVFTRKLLEAVVVGSFPDAAKAGQIKWSQLKSDPSPTILPSAGKL